MSSVNIFNTGKSGLFANRAALATTGHNIANVNTEGYSRQRVEQTTNMPSQIGNTVFGTGTRVKQVHRINDEFLSKQISHEMKLIGQYEEKELALSQAEEIFNEVNNTGMNKLISKFFNEFRKLANEPESEALRATVRESADQLTGDFHRLARSIGDVQKNIDVRLDSAIRETNELVQQVAKLNEEIKRFELSGGEAGDLRDARELAIKKLSRLVDIQVASNEKGELTVALAGIGPLVSGSLFNKLYSESAKADEKTGRPEGSKKIMLENLVAPDITSRLQNGRMGGLLEARDAILGGSMRRLDELAYTLASKMNALHRQGYNLNGSTGVNFFKEPTKIHQAAEHMALSAELREDSNYIAAGLLPDAPGDNRLIQYIAKLQHAKVMSNGNATFDDHYNSTVADLATVTQKNKLSLEQEGHIMTHLEKVRESISGVSLDEETTNLVQFQHAFDASAKVIKVADEMLDTILHLRG